MSGFVWPPNIDIFDQNLKKVEIFMSCFFTCHVLVKFSPLFGDHWLQRAGKGSRRFRAPRQWSHWWETEQQTRGLNQDCYMSQKSANMQANVIYPKINFLYWYRNMLFFKVSHFEHSDKILLH